MIVEVPQRVGMDTRDRAVAAEAINGMVARDARLAFVDPATVGHAVRSVSTPSGLRHMGVQGPLGGRDRWFGLGMACRAAR